MKKTMIVWMLTALAGLTTLIDARAADPPEIGKITRLRGAAYINRVGKVKAIPVKLGMAVHLNDRVNTAKKSRLRIELKDGSLLSLGAKGQLHLDDFEFDRKTKKRSAFFTVALGKLRVFANDLVKFKKKSFKIKTPTAVCGVRGTLFMVWVQSSTITKVICFDNAVQVASVFDPTQFVELTPNLATDIVSGQAPTAPVLMTPEQLQELQLDLEALDASEIAGDEPPPDETPPEETGGEEETRTEETTTEETTTEETTTEATTTEETTTEATTTEATTTEATTTEVTTTGATTTAPTTTAASTTAPTTSTTTTTAPTTTTTTTTSTSTTTTTTTTTSTSTTTLPLQVLPGPPLPPS